MNLRLIQTVSISHGVLALSQLSGNSEAIYGWENGHECNLVYSIMVQTWVIL